MVARAPRLRAIAPWVVAAAILVYVLWNVPLDALGEALGRVSWPALVALSAVYVAGLLLADSLAMWIGFRAALNVTPRYREAVLLRGASMLAALVNYGAGQAGIVYFLNRRHGVPIAESAGAVLFTTGAFLVVVALAVSAGLAAGAVPYPQLRLVAFVIAGVGLPIYLTIVRLRPEVLVRQRLLAPLFAAGVRGTLAVAAARGVHLVVLLAGHFVALRLFGIEVPPGAALVLMPVLFLVSALPIAPAGLGTTQAAAVALFAGYAAGSVDEARSAVLAYSLAFQFVPMPFVIAIGLYCLRWTTRERAAAEAADAAAGAPAPPPASPAPPAAPPAPPAPPPPPASP